MKGSRMNVETLSKAELLMLLSILEGELEAQDVVIHTLRAQQRDAFVQERYGHYNLRDPFIALLRDSELSQAQDDGGQSPVCLNPLGVLKLVMAHCTNMKEKMMKQLAAAERRRRWVIADLEEEKRRRAQDNAAGDDITAMLEKERDRLLQQLEFERAQVERLERERSVLSNQAEEDLAQQQQLSSTLAKECQKATARAEEESQRVAELSRQLEQESSTIKTLKGELESERAHAQQIEARAERKLAELDTEREQMRGKLLKEEKRYQEILEKFNSLKKELDEMKERETAGLEKDNEENVKTTGIMPPLSQTEVDGKAIASKSSPQPKLNGHHTPREPESPADERCKEVGSVDNGVVLPGGSGALQCLSPSSPASSSLSSSPCSSPVLTKRLASIGCSSPTYPSSYQASINQRFQAARHKFQQQAEAEQQHGASVVHSPRDLSPTAAAPTTPDNSTAKQIARNTVTQVLSRFTSQQATSKLPPSNSSPFGTDYRNLAAASSPTGKSPLVLSPGIHSPIIPRAEKIHPPSVPPKKQGVNQSPGSPVPSGRASHFPELSGSCGLTSGQEDAKELDLVVS
ncbi:CTTNBP2 N-terminal-like protein [Sinocyclocheilus anshuiensis]|uniref:CTTNBP2 N-terminal-like protein n=1 Tax=Sinocyclocheilus anshuiensis TaxID=1608454 RepID=A0A671LPW1_9TELE|nr:PREDICTED: CTTNBP2 N-terminal-like protein [Sinocyclocheilus anshuiensis]